MPTSQLKTGSRPGRKAGTQPLRTTSPARKAARKATPPTPVAIVNAAPPVSGREAQLRQSMAADFKDQMHAAGIPMSDSFAMELATEAASVIAAVDRRVESLRQSLGAVRLMAAVRREPVTGLSMLLEERRAIAEALDLTAGSEALITALEARSRELDEQIVNRPAQTGHELAAKIGMAIDALNDGEGADSVLPILASCRSDACSLPAPTPARCTPSAG